MIYGYVRTEKSRTAIEAVLRNEIMAEYGKSGWLRILATPEAKNSKICNFWTFWLVTQLMNHLVKISLHFTGQNVQKLLILTYFG